MKRIPDAVLAEMARGLSDHDREEMAIPSYRHPNPAMRWMAWRRVEVVARVLQRFARERDELGTIVDFGCGTGVLLEQSCGVAERVIGVDLQLGPARVLADLRNLDVELMTPDQAYAEVQPKSVDVVLAAEVLEHVEPLPDTIDSLRRWLKPDGCMIVSLPTENRLYRLGRKLAGFAGHYHHDNAESIDRALRQRGFVRRSRVRIPLPGPLAIYWVLQYEPVA